VRKQDSHEAALPSGQPVAAHGDAEAVLVGRTLAAVERDLILDTLRHCLGNRTRTANVLGISVRTLRNKLKEYALDGAAVPPPGGGEGAGAP
jgi:DNA-binding NtrC family response regulator